jgi:hypothetical protein
MSPDYDYFDIIMNNRTLQIVHSGPPASRGGGGCRGRGAGLGGRGGVCPLPRRRVDDNGGCCIVM